MTPAEYLAAAANVATAVGVLVAAWQLYLAKGQAESQFEDSLNAEYRTLLQQLPLNALLGRHLEATELSAHLAVFYRYFDLSNEQAFLAARGRVRPNTWANWRDGIEQNLARPGFRQAWCELLPDLDGSFDDLKAVIADSRCGELLPPASAPADA